MKKKESKQIRVFKQLYIDGIYAVGDVIRRTYAWHTKLKTKELQLQKILQDNQVMLIMTQYLV